MKSKLAILSALTFFCAASAMADLMLPDFTMAFTSSTATNTADGTTHQSTFTIQNSPGAGGGVVGFFNPNLTDVSGPDSNPLSDFSISVTDGATDTGYAFGGNAVDVNYYVNYHWHSPWEGKPNG